jgi:hypothetical protein
MSSDAQLGNSFLVSSFCVSSPQPMVAFEEEPPLALVPLDEEPTPQVHQHPPEAAAGLVAIDHLNGDDHLRACESPGCALLGLPLPLPCQCKVLDLD